MNGGSCASRSINVIAAATEFQRDMGGIRAADHRSLLLLGGLGLGLGFGWKRRGKSSPNVGINMKNCGRRFTSSPLVS